MHAIKIRLHSHSQASIFSYRIFQYWLEMALLRGNIAALVAAVAPAEMHPLLVQLQAVLNIVDQINIWKMGNNQVGTQFRPN